MSSLSGYRIYLFTTDGLWDHVGSVHNGEIANLTSPKLPPAVQQLNAEVFKEIRRVQGTQTQSDYSIVSKVCGPENDQMEFLILETMHYRRCTIYIVLQFSHKTTHVRVLAYGTDQVLHDGQSFGTSLTDVSDCTLINEIHDTVKKRLAPCNMGINFTALKRLQESDYTLFV